MINGEQLANTSDIQLEKIIKNYFHRKKLRLAIQIANKNCDELTIQASKLDYFCVARWLDDIGLPQYKELFLENRIDGAVLNVLTVEDLLRLKINTQLHHSSFKTGILVLRMNSFNQNCYIRRASPVTEQPLNNSSNSNHQQINSLNVSLDSAHTYDPNEVALWSSHRVMEWLRAIDLAEYCVCLRSSGIHGGLIIFEDSFNSNVLASLLGIPPGKSLLRRHISTYLTQLIGFNIAQRKHQYQDRTGNTQMSAFTKVKVSFSF